jgi:magnesium and cobalt transporter
VEIEIRYASAVLTTAVAKYTVSDPYPARPSDKEDKRGLLQKIAEFLHPSPDTKDELIDSLVQAQDNDIINEESRRMLEGVIRMSDMTAGDVMVAAAKMDLLSIDAPAATLLNQIIDTGHSRFPVYEGERENILGILLAKDMLKLQRAPELNIKTLLRPAVFVPESKRLNDLLRPDHHRGCARANRGRHRRRVRY